MKRFFSPSLKVSIHHTLPEDSRVEGTLTFKGGLLVNGTVHGQLIPQGAKPTLTVGENGEVDVPALEVDTLIVNGRMRAKSLKAKRVVLGAKSNVKADIESQVIEIHTGAVFDGRVTSSGEARSGSGLGASNTKAAGSADLARQRLDDLVGAKISRDGTKNPGA